MRLLHAIGTLDPAYGGPVEGVRRLIPALSSLGHESHVLTLDAPDAPWLAATPGVVHAVGPARGRYRYSGRMAPWLRRCATQYDAIVVNGIWQYQSVAVWRAARRVRTPYYVYVHGALDPWFRRRFPMKHVKKQLYWPWAEYRVLRDAQRVLFTCDEERDLARGSFWPYRVRAAVVGYGIADPPGTAERQRQAFFEAYPHLRDTRPVLFLSRLHPKKGCDLLIEAFAEVAGEDPRLHLVMAGPDERGWQAELQALAGRLGVGARVTWTGLLEGDLKWGAFRAADCFALPSHSENFGVVVAEALACGVPVLISRRVNIWREIVAAGAGSVAEDTAEGARGLLRGWVALDPSEASRMRVRARDCFEAHFQVERAARALADTIAGGLDREDRPPTGSAVGGGAS